MRRAARPARVDVRLVPAALTSWAVTAAGILWPVGAVVTALCAAVAAVSGCTRWRPHADRTAAARSSRRRDRGRCRRGGVRFGDHVARQRGRRPPDHRGVRHRDAGDRHAHGESPIDGGTGRLMFRADVAAAGAPPSPGRVVVFAPVLRLRRGDCRSAAAIPGAESARPTRRDLSVAVLTAVGRAGDRSGRADTAGCAGQFVDASPRRPAGAAGRAGRDAARAGARGHVGGATGDQSRIPRGRADASDRGIRCQRHDRLRRGAVGVVRLVGPRVAVGLAAVALVGFVIVVQPTASVLRAAVMGAIALLAVLSSRRRQAIPALRRPCSP